MKIILKETVDNLGTVGDVVAVRAGYGRNYLIPRGLAIPADSRSVKAVEHEKKTLEKRRLRELGKSQELAQALAAVRLTFQRRASDLGHLFGSVTSADIEEALAAKGFVVSRKQLSLDQPLKALGEFTVPAKLSAGVKAQVKVVVQAEAEAEAEAEAAG